MFPLRTHKLSLSFQGPGLNHQPTGLEVQEQHFIEEKAILYAYLLYREILLDTATKPGLKLQNLYED